MTHLLHVQTQTGTVGQLAFGSQDDRYSFTYEPAWSSAPRAFALSPHIPLNAEPSSPGSVHRFLANLLPEGRALEVASVMYQMSKDNTFGLVRMLGKEPVGALSFRAVDDEAAPVGNADGEDEDDPQRRIITHDELSERIRERDSMPFPVWDRKVRLSVAGYQDKLQVLVEGERISLVDGTTLSSTYILKPDSRNDGTPHMVANEHFCMTLASRIGLPAAPVSIRRIPEPILLIQRFDRAAVLDVDGVTARSVHRLHIIDGCQALDLPVSFKYERNFGHTRDVRTIREGVSFEKLFSLDSQLEMPALARQWMLRWALFQLLIGNSDAHGKNLSFFVRPVGLAPAPFYDLVSVQAYGEHVEQEMALAYGDAFRLDEISPLELADFSNRTRIPRPLVARELIRMARAVKATAPDLAQSKIYENEERDLVQRISTFVVAQADRMIRMATELPKVDAALL